MQSIGLRHTVVDMFDRMILEKSVACESLGAEIVTHLRNQIRFDMYFSFLAKRFICNSTHNNQLPLRLSSRPFMGIKAPYPFSSSNTIMP